MFSEWYCDVSTCISNIFWSGHSYLQAWYEGYKMSNMSCAWLNRPRDVILACVCLNLVDYLWYVKHWGSYIRSVVYIHTSKPSFVYTVWYFHSLWLSWVKVPECDGQTYLFNYLRHDCRVILSLAVWFDHWKKAVNTRKLRTVNIIA